MHPAFHVVSRKVTHIQADRPFILLNGDSVHDPRHHGVERRTKRQHVKVSTVVSPARLNGRRDGLLFVQPSVYLRSLCPTEFTPCVLLNLSETDVDSIKSDRKTFERVSEARYFMQSRY